jgi:hypothetical protein
LKPLEAAGAGESQSFVLYVTDVNRKVWIRKADGSPLGILDEGRWEARLTVSSDNAHGFEGVLSFTVSRHFGAVPDSTALAMRRRAVPRMQI